MDEEAAAWLTRLRNRSISTAELEEFASWRRDPEHAAAYERVQALWDDSARLSNDPDIQRALHSGIEDTRRTSGQFVTHPVMALGAVACCILLLVGMLSYQGAGSRSYQTAVGERSSVRLSDGTGVQLDTDSEVTARFSTNERRVKLAKGQAFFQVTHAADRPFVVDAGDGITITVLGTQFDVRRTADRVMIALVSGAVVVRRGDAELARMRPGSVVAVALGNGTVATTTTVAEAISWRGGHLSFRETPLAEAVAEINRYTENKLQIRDATAHSEPISGEFSTDDPQGFGQAVNALLGKDTIGQ